MRHHDRALAGLLATVCLAAVFLGMSSANAQSSEPPLVATPQAECGPGARPETGIQGRVPAADHANGRNAQGYQCNAERVGFHEGQIGDGLILPDLDLSLGLDELLDLDIPFGTKGGFKVERYTDSAGNDCAYYDSSLLLGTDLFDGGVGVTVLDMNDPTNPVKTANLITPAMLSPHESMVVSQTRGLLMATLGNPAFNVGLLDIYDIRDDCRNPQLKSTSPAGILGHESGVSPDGNTFYSASPATQTLVAVDVSNPSLPVPITVYQLSSHGLSISADGNRAYVASLEGLVILDISEVQARQSNPVIREVSRLAWSSMSIPQNAIPFTISGHPYLLEIDEFGAQSEVGGARIIDIADEENPFVLSNMRLAVHQPENFAAQAADIGNTSPIQGYAGHYCNVPTRVNPTIVACSMIMSGLRIFSIVDPANPVEIAYYNSPSEATPIVGGNYAMSSPSFVPERDEIWYSDGFTGFHVVRLTNNVWPVFADVAQPVPADPTTSEVAAPPATPTGSLPATGGSFPMVFALVAACSGLGALWLLVGRRQYDTE